MEKCQKLSLFNYKHGGHLPAKRPYKGVEAGFHGLAVILRMSNMKFVKLEFYYCKISDMFEHVQPFSNLFKLVQTCLNLFILAQTCFWVNHEIEL